MSIPQPTATHDDDARRQLLVRILRAEPSMPDDVQELARLPFDAPEPLVELTLTQTRDVLARHARGLISDSDIELWAVSLEARDDVALDRAHEPALRECLFQLSTPELTGKSMPQLADDWRARLAQIPAQPDSSPE